MHIFYNETDAKCSLQTFIENIYANYQKVKHNSAFPLANPVIESITITEYRTGHKSEGNCTTQVASKAIIILK